MKKLFAAFIGVCLMLTLVGGCASADKNVKTGQLLKIGICPNYPPIIYKKNGKISGIEADLAQYVSDKLNSPVEFVELPFAELIPSVEKGEIDVVMSGLSLTEARKEKVRFVEPYFNIGQMALIKKSEEKRFSSFEGIYETTLKVGCQKGTTGEIFVKENMPKAKLVTFENPEKAIEALNAGSLDLFIGDAPYVLNALNNNKNLEALSWLLTTESLAWAMPQNEGYDYIYDKLNEIVLHAKQSGDMRRILNNYFEVSVKIK